MARDGPASKIGPMPPPARITVEFACLPQAPQVALTVPTGTPSGGVWGLLPAELRQVGPPPGVRYRLNGLRTIPGAPLRDGDRLVVAGPDEETTR